MDLGLEGKLALVTGAGVGIGRAAALVMAGEGANLALVSRSAGNLDETADRARALGVEVETWTADLGAAGEGERVVAAAHERFGRLDALVNTVGPTERSEGILDQDDDLWSRTYDALLMSAVRTCRAAVPIMKKAGGGAIVNTSAMSIRHWIPFLAHYSSAKAALAHFTKNLAQEFAHDGIRSNAVMPGMTASEPIRERMAKALEEKGMTEAEYVEDANRRYGHVTWADRFGEPQEVGNVIAFLCSDKASYVNGAWWNVDGGTSF